MTTTTDDKTANLTLPLPHPQNSLIVDVARIRSAFSMLDAAYAELEFAISGKAAPSDITNGINAVLGAVPTALNTLKKLADAIGNDPNYATTQANQIASLQNSQTTQANQIASLQNSQVPLSIVYAGL